MTTFRQRCAKTATILLVGLISVVFGVALVVLCVDFVPSPWSYLLIVAGIVVGCFAATSPGAEQRRKAGDSSSPDRPAHHDRRD